MRKCSYRTTIRGRQSKVSEWQCSETEVGNFGTTNEPLHLCILHAPSGSEPVDRSDWHPSHQSELKQKRFEDVLFPSEEGPDSKIVANPIIFPGVIGVDLDLNGAIFKNTVCLQSGYFLGFSINGSEFQKEFVAENIRVEHETSVRETKFQGSFIVRGSRFCKDVCFYKANFEGNFYSDDHENKIDFIRCIFVGRIDITSSKFKWKTSFNLSKIKDSHIQGVFKDELSLAEAELKQIAIYDSTIKILTVRGAHLEKRIRILTTNITESLNFLWADVSDTVQIHDCKFNNIRFDRTSVSGTMIFQDCTINEVTYDATNVTGSLRLIRCRPYLDKEAVKGWKYVDQNCRNIEFLECDLSRISILGSDIRSTTFDSCIWPRKGRYEYLPEHDLALGSGDQQRQKLLLSAYKQIKRKMEDDRQYAEASGFHFREMQVRESLMRPKISLDRLIMQLYGLVSDYGESWKKALVSLVLVILFTSIIISLIETKLTSIEAFTQVINDMPKYLYLSFFGMIPNSFQKSALAGANLSTASQLCIVFASMIAIVLITLFIFAIRRRFRH